MCVFKSPPGDFCACVCLSSTVKHLSSQPLFGASLGREGNWWLFREFREQLICSPPNSKQKSSTPYCICYLCLKSLHQSKTVGCHWVSENAPFFPSTSHLLLPLFSPQGKAFEANVQTQCKWKVFQKLGRLVAMMLAQAILDSRCSSLKVLAIGDSRPGLTGHTPKD